MIKRKKLLSIIATTFILLICFFVSLYLLGINSDSYRFALNYIDSSKIVKEKLGRLKDSRLAFWGYSVRYNGPNGYADYEILVKGDKDKGTIYINMQKTAGEWKVLKANLKLPDDKIVHITN